MYAVLLVIHVLVAILLVASILIQRGRGGGLAESFSGMESMFGTKTSQFLIRTTAVLGTIFLITSISLAVLSARQTRSLIRKEAISEKKKEPEESRQVVKTKMPSAGKTPVQESLPE